MSDKLEALSQPVAFVYQIAGACVSDYPNPCGKWVDWRTELSCECPPDWMIEEGKVKDLKPRYSQEYVTALREDAARWFNAFEKAVSAGARYEERIEALQQQAVKDGNRIAELEQRLQQPIPESLIDSVCHTAAEIFRARHEDKAQEIIDNIREMLTSAKGV